MTQPSNLADNEDGTFVYAQETPPHSPHHTDEDDNPMRTELLFMLHNFVKHAIHIPLQQFQVASSEKDAARRIKKATVPAIFLTTAQRIDAAISKEPPADRVVLSGLITDVTKQQTEDLHRRVQSLYDQLETHRAKLGISGNQPTQPATKKSKKGRGSSNLIWNRKETTYQMNPAPAVNQRFHQHAPRSTKRKSQSLDPPQPLQRDKPSTPTDQSLARDSGVKPNASDEHAGKRGKKKGRSRNDLS